MSARAARNSLMPGSLLLGLVWALFRPFLTILARAPLSVTTLALVIAGYFYAGANALYWQGEHVAVLPEIPVVSTRTPAARDPIGEAIGSIPVTTPVPAPSYRAPIDPGSTQSVSPRRVEIPGPVVGNPDAFRVQSLLKSLGLFTQEVDGYYGPMTAAAIRGFEARAGLTPTGAISAQLIEALEESYLRGAIRQQISMAPIPAAPVGDPLAAIAMTAAENAAQSTDPQRQLVMAVQRGLASLGFLHGEIDGIMGEATSRAIRNFEVFHNYRVTGEVSPELLDLLQAANASF